MTEGLELLYMSLLFGAAVVLPFWPLIVLRVLVDGGRWYRAMLAMWGLLAVLWLFQVMSSRAIQPFMKFLPEPLNTTLFILTGVGLLTLNVWIWYKGKRKFLRKAGKVRGVEELQELTPAGFEKMVAELYRRLGHKARRAGRSGDHGVDVVVDAKNGEKWVVQCKRWRGKVGEPQVRDFYGTMQHEKVEQGAIITTGGFSRPARNWARGKPIHLYDGEAFLKAWKKSQKLQQ